MNSLKHILNKHRLEAFVVLFLIVVAVLYFSNTTIAQGPYIAPGPTEPGCPPTDTDCFVYPIAIDSIVGNATSGSITFIGIGGVLSQDNTNLFWNNARALFTVDGSSIDSSSANSTAINQSVIGTNHSLSFAVAGANLGDDGSRTVGLGAVTTGLSVTDSVLIGISSFIDGGSTTSLAMMGGNISTFVTEGIAIGSGTILGETTNGNVAIGQTIDIQINSNNNAAVGQNLTIGENGANVYLFGGNGSSGFGASQVIGLGNNFTLGEGSNGSIAIGQAFIGDFGGDDIAIGSVTINSTGIAQTLNSIGIGQTVIVGEEANDSLAIGSRAEVTAGSIEAGALGAFVRAAADGAFVIGNGIDSSNKLINSITQSLAFGSNSDTPTMRIFGGDGTSGSIGHIRISPRASLPTTPDSVLGDIYVDTSGAFCFYNGVGWDNLASEGTCL